VVLGADSVSWPPLTGYTTTRTGHSKLVHLHWPSDVSDQETSTWQQTHSQKTENHVRGVTRTHNPSKRPTADPSLRRRGHWNRTYLTFINSAVVCLTTGPRPLPNRAFHIEQSSAFSFKCEYPLLCLRSSSSCLRFLPRLPVTSIPLLSFLQ
jgi:hypothetical protein